MIPRVEYHTLNSLAEVIQSVKSPEREAGILKHYHSLLSLDLLSPRSVISSRACRLGLCPRLFLVPEEEADLSRSDVLR